MELKTPKSLKEEHDELHSQLTMAMQAGGASGRAAKNVARALGPHFQKEEEYALPPLGLLQVIAKGEVMPEMQGAIEMADRLKADLSQMLLEHSEIVNALRDLMEAARLDERVDIQRFAKELMLHARTEEEVLYPASIIVGEYLRLRL